MMGMVQTVDYEKYLGKPKWLPIPSPLYIDEDANLELRVWNSLAGVALSYRARFLECDGSVHGEEQALTVTADRTQQVTRARARRGYLLSLSVFPTAGTPRRGQTFVAVTLARGLQGDVQFLHELARGYVTAGHALLWPGGAYADSVDGQGVPRSITGFNPGAGVECNDAVPTGARWRLRGWREQLVTSAVAGNRQVHLVIDDGATQLLDLPANGTQAASVTRYYDASAMAAIPAGIANEIFIALPQDLVLFQGWRIRTITNAIDAGDNYGPTQLDVEEWIEA